MIDLLACAWGTAIATPDDTEPCPVQASKAVVLHNGDAKRLFKLCPRHMSRMLDETDPHVDHP